MFVGQTETIVVVRFDFDQVWEFPTHRIGFIHDRHPRMPNLFERVTDNSATGVGQSPVFPAQHDCDFSGEILLGTVDAGDVHNPNSSR